ncbi:DUF6350 family protein, partial [Micromonospora harpali]
LRDGVRTGLVAGLLLLGAVAGAAGLAVATGGGDAADMIGAYRTGVAGQAGITLVSLAYAPNATIWSVSYLLGPGFAVGVDTAVRTSEVSVGALPAVPLLAGLPSGPVDGYGAGLLAVPVLAGMAAWWLLARRLLLAAAEGYRRPFTRAEPGVRDLLAAHLDSGTAHWPTVSDLVRVAQEPPARPGPEPGRELDEPLTERELTILRYLQSILSNVEIAAELSLSVNTVKTHVRNIYRKLDATRRREAVRRARELHLI